MIILFVHIFLKIDSGEKSFSIYLFCIAADSNKFQLFNFQLNNPEIGITFFFNRMTLNVDNEIDRFTQNQVCETPEIPIIQRDNNQRI